MLIENFGVVVLVVLMLLERVVMDFLLVVGVVMGVGIVIGVFGCFGVGLVVVIGFFVIGWFCGFVVEVSWIELFDLGVFLDVVRGVSVVLLLFDDFSKW